MNWKLKPKVCVSPLDISLGDVNNNNGITVTVTRL